MEKHHQDLKKMLLHFHRTLIVLVFFKYDWFMDLDPAETVGYICRFASFLSLLLVLASSIIQLDQGTFFSIVPSAILCATEY